MRVLSSFILVSIINIIQINAQHKIHFFKGTWEEALQKAGQEDKMVYLDAHAVWCGPCRMMDKRVFTDSLVMAYYDERFINYKMDMERGIGPKLLDKYYITAYPTHFFLNSNGDPVYREMGYLKPKHFINLGKAAFNAYNKKRAKKQKHSKVENNIYQFKVNDIKGEIFDFNTLKGKKIMIVNTASKCGLTPQYEALQSLYKKYKSSDFEIVAFPANNFLKQEPGTNEEIYEFCDKKFNITFPLMAKLSVKGDDMHPLYQFLTQEEKNGLTDSKVKWNFQKYLIDRDGKLIKIINPKTSPLSDEVVNWVKEK